MTNTLIALVGERCETVAFFFRKEEGKREGKEKWREKVRWRSRRRTEKLDRSRLEEKKKKRGRVAAFRIRLLFDIVRLVIDRSSRPTRLPLKLKNEPSHKGHFKMEERERKKRTLSFVFSSFSSSSSSFSSSCLLTLIPSATWRVMPFVYTPVLVTRPLSERSFISLRFSIVLRRRRRRKNERATKK